MTLQNREQSFQQAILDALPAEVCLLDESGTILSVNRAWLEFSASNDGPEAKTGVGANYLAVCDATEGPDREFAEKVARNLRCMLRGELNQFTLQYPCPSADSLLWFVLQAVRSSESDPRLVVITHTNITQLKQAEEKQRLDFQRHRVLFEEAPEGIVVLDEERKIIEANNGFARMLGFSRPEQVLGLHPWDWDPIYSTREKLLAAWPELPTQPQVHMTQFRRTDGQILNVEISNYPATIAGKKTVFCVCRDLTKRLATEQRLQLFKTFAEQSNIGTAVGAVKDKRLVYVNARFALDHGWDTEELVGRPIAILHNKEQMPRVHTLLEIILSEGGFSTEEVWQTRKDGTVYPALMSASLIRDETSEPQFMAVTAIDISKQKEAERALAQRAVELEARNEELYRFNMAAVDRELRMIELKNEVNELCRSAGLPERYSNDAARIHSQTNAAHSSGADYPA